MSIGASPQIRSEVMLRLSSKPLKPIVMEEIYFSQAKWMFICINTTDYNGDDSCGVLPFTLLDADANGIDITERMHR